MKHVAVVSVIALVLFAAISCLSVSARAATTDGRDDLTINPIPTPEPEEPELVDVLGDYVWNRFRDLADILTIKLGWGTDKAIGFQARLCYPIQIGAGIFEGYVFAIDRGCVGVMKEAEIEGGVSIYYPSFIARKVTWQTEEAKRRNVFFGDVGEKGEIKWSELKAYDDENAGWLTSTAQIQLPYLPKIELTVNWGEIPDFVLSIFGIPGFRVPPAFHKIPGPDGEKAERIPAPGSIFWHGQEKEFERYE